MKSALKYIIPLICFVAFFGGNEAVVNGQYTCAAVETAMHSADFSAEDTECILTRTTSTVNGAQRVSKNVRQGKPGQRRYSDDLKACQAPVSRYTIWFNANPKKNFSRISILPADWSVSAGLSFSRFRLRVVS
ncbi:MAG: hypothetical protein IJZ31_05240 [Bacteroidaceae bacterium]|nr:hypothetical protein [Bacteroidaceae bacterium]